MKSLTFDIKWLALSAGLVLGMLFSSLIVQAATTISTDIATAGGYTQTGTSANTFTGQTTLAAASSTGNVSIAGALWIGGNATTTAAGAISTQGGYTQTGTSANTFTGATA